jgi:hypothetical protein
MYYFSANKETKVEWVYFVQTTPAGSYGDRGAKNWYVKRCIRVIQTEKL